MRPFTILAVTLAITGALVALFTVAMLPIGLPGTLEYTLIALILFPVTGVTYHRHVRRALHRL